MPLWCVLWLPVAWLLWFAPPGSGSIFSFTIPLRLPILLIKTLPSHVRLQPLPATAVTHIICCNLPDAKVKHLQKERSPTPIVRPEWIVDSLQAGAVLPVRATAEDWRCSWKHSRGSAACTLCSAESHPSCPPALPSPAFCCPRCRSKTMGCSNCGMHLASRSSRVFSRCEEHFGCRQTAVCSVLKLMRPPDLSCCCRTNADPASGAAPQRHLW